jgi:hypothetical protein
MHNFCYLGLKAENTKMVIMQIYVLYLDNVSL